MGPRLKLNFFRIWSCCISNKADNAGSNMVENILPTDTPSTQGVVSKGQTIYFSESSHVAYQIKDDDTGSTHASKYFAHRHTLDPGGGVKRSNYIFF